ncbi:MAG: flavocytochrome c [Burkholderiaceae bacterium]
MALGPAQAKPIEPMPAKWDETADVVVIGSGFAGLAAAIEAKKAGANVIVLEKMRTPGGNSIINGGIIAVPGSAVQKEKGIVDSPEVMAADIFREGQGLSHPELVKVLTASAVSTYEWTINELGVKYREGRVGQEGGHAVPRHLFTHNSSGSGIVNQQLLKLKELGVEPRCTVFMERIIRDADGRVKGVQVREGYRFPNATSGKVKMIRANKAVILAHGGFGADVAYRALHDPKLSAKFGTTNQPGATSEAWRESARIGCNIIQADWIQVGPWTSPDEKGMGLAPSFAGNAAQFGLWVECSSGKRFVNELANRKVRADAVVDRLNKGDQCLAICDAGGGDLLEANRPGALQKIVDAGVAKRYANLDEVAAAYKIPLPALRKTVDHLNRYIQQGKDEEFGRYLSKEAKPIGQGPFYVVRLSPKVHHCMGGIAINTKAQALDVSTDQPIPGLYAAGEAAGGVHGAVRLGSVATVDCLAFGRIAGQNAVKEIAWS